MEPPQFQFPSKASKKIWVAPLGLAAAFVDAFRWTTFIGRHGHTFTRILGLLSPVRAAFVSSHITDPFLGSIHSLERNASLEKAVGATQP